VTEQEIFEIVQGIFRNVFDQDSLLIKNETTAADIEDWDSLNQINLIVAMEKTFKIKFALTDIQNLKNVGEMINLITKKLKAP
jgi:acyl carrier protein